MGLGGIFSCLCPALGAGARARQQNAYGAHSGAARGSAGLERVNIDIFIRQPKQADAELLAYLVLARDDADPSVCGISGPAASELFSVAFASASLLSHLGCNSRQEYLFRLGAWLSADAELADQVAKLVRCAATLSAGMVVYPLEDSVQLHDGVYNVSLTFKACLIVDAQGVLSSEGSGPGRPALAVSHKLSRLDDLSAMRQQEMALTTIPSIVTALLMDGRVVYQNPRSQQYMGNLVSSYNPPPGTNLLALSSSMHPLKRLFRFDSEAMQAFEAAMTGEMEFRRVVKVPKRIKHPVNGGNGGASGGISRLASRVMRRERPGASRLMRQVSGQDHVPGPIRTDAGHEAAGNSSRGGGGGGWSPGSNRSGMVSREASMTRVSPVSVRRGLAGSSRRGGLSAAASAAATRRTSVLLMHAGSSMALGGSSTGFTAMGAGSATGTVNGTPGLTAVAAGVGRRMVRRCTSVSNLVTRGGVGAVGVLGRVANSPGSSRAGSSTVSRTLSFLGTTGGAAAAVAASAPPPQQQPPQPPQRLLALSPGGGTTIIKPVAGISTVTPLCLSGIGMPQEGPGKTGSGAVGAGGGARSGLSWSSGMSLVLREGIANSGGVDFDGILSGAHHTNISAPPSQGGLAPIGETGPGDAGTGVGRSPSTRLRRLNSDATVSSDNCSIATGRNLSGRNLGSRPQLSLDDSIQPPARQEGGAHRGGGGGGGSASASAAHHTTHSSTQLSMESAPSSPLLVVRRATRSMLHRSHSNIPVDSGVSVSQGVPSGATERSSHRARRTSLTMLNGAGALAVSASSFRRSASEDPVGLAHSGGGTSSRKGTGTGMLSSAASSAATSPQVSGRGRGASGRRRPVEREPPAAAAAAALAHMAVELVEVTPTIVDENGQDIVDGTIRQYSASAVRQHLLGAAAGLRPGHRPPPPAAGAAAREGIPMLGSPPGGGGSPVLACLSHLASGAAASAAGNPSSNRSSCHLLSSIQEECVEARGSNDDDGSGVPRSGGEAQGGASPALIIAPEAMWSSAGGGMRNLAESSCGGRSAAASSGLLLECAESETSVEHQVEGASAFNLPSLMLGHLNSSGGGMDKMMSGHHLPLPSLNLGMASGTSDMDDLSYNSGGGGAGAAMVSFHAVNSGGVSSSGVGSQGSGNIFRGFGAALAGMSRPDTFQQSQGLGLALRLRPHPQLQGGPAGRAAGDVDPPAGALAAGEAGSQGRALGSPAADSMTSQASMMEALQHRGAIAAAVAEREARDHGGGGGSGFASRRLLEPVTTSSTGALGPLYGMDPQQDPDQPGQRPTSQPLPVSYELMHHASRVRAGRAVAGAGGDTAALRHASPPPPHHMAAYAANGAVASQAGPLASTTLSSRQATWDAPSSAQLTSGTADATLQDLEQMMQSPQRQGRGGGDGGGTLVVLDLARSSGGAFSPAVLMNHTQGMDGSGLGGVDSQYQRSSRRQASFTAQGGGRGSGAAGGGGTSGLVDVGDLHRTWAAGDRFGGGGHEVFSSFTTQRSADVGAGDGGRGLSCPVTCPVPGYPAAGGGAAAAAGGSSGAGTASGMGATGRVPMRRRNTKDRLMSLLTSLSREESEDEETGDEHEWHDVYACVRVEASSGRAVAVITQTEVTEQVEVQRKLEALLEHEHKVLESIFPRHVIEHMTLQAKHRNASAGAAAGGTAVGSSWANFRGSAMEALATSHSCVTILFCDIIGFTEMCKEVSAMVVMRFLNTLYMKFDELIDIYGVYKVETIGDCYMVAGGLVRTDVEGNKSVIGDGSEDALHAVRVMSFAKAIMREASEVVLPTSGDPVQLRIGLHSGPVMSGIVGDKMPRFCLFGDTVNTASRMESTCPPGAIHVSADTRSLLNNEAWVATGGVQIKGKGLLETHVWAGHAAEEDEDAERRLKVYL